MASGSVITLLTDFGTTDSYVAEVKGVLLTRAPGAILVDITHDVPAGDVLAAQVIINRTWHRFPPGTVHLCVVDPGVGTARRAVALAAAGHWFVGPDNGIFTGIAGDEMVALPVPAGASPTFHGRDLFAPAAAALAGGAPLGSLGAPAADPVRAPLAEARRVEGAVVGDVLLVDRFGNLITNVPADVGGAGARVVIAGVDAGPVRRTFGDAPAGGLVAYAGSGGTIEIAVRDGSAAAFLRAGRGSEVRVLGG